MEKNHKSQIGQELKYQVTGWTLFIIKLCVFIASSLKNHDTLTFIGGVIFLIACIVFLIPLVRSNKNAENGTKAHDDKKII